MRPLEKVVPCACTTRTTGMSGLGETSREPASHLALATHLAGQCLASSGTFRVLTAAQQIETATWYGGDGSAIREKCRQVREFQIATYSTSLYIFMDSFSSLLSLSIETRSSGREMQKSECENCDGTREIETEQDTGGQRSGTGGKGTASEREGLHVLVRGMDDMETGREVERRELRSGKGTERATGKVRLRDGPPIAHERAERRSSGTVSRREGTRMREERKREEGRVSEQVSNEWRFAPPRHHPSLIRTHAAEPGGGGSSSTWPCRTRRRQSTRT